MTTKSTTEKAITNKEMKKKLYRINKFKLFERSLIVFLLVYLFTSSLSAQNNLQFIHLDKDNGLSDNSVNTIFQDSYGYLWIGTWNGLSKFDGYKFENYVTWGNENSLPGNWIFSIFEDSENTLWVGTNAGVVYYDRNKNRFLQPPDSDYNGVKAIFETKSKQLWCSLINGINIYDVTKKKLIKYISLKNDTTISNIETIINDNKGRAWVGSLNGLYIIDISSFKILKHITSKTNSSLQSDRIKTIRFDHDGKLWIGTEQDGICVMDTSKFTSTSFRHDPDNDKTIVSDNVEYIYIDKNNNVWVGCLSGYLNKYNREKKQFDSFSGDNYNDRHIKSKSIGFIGQDNEDNYWIGTHGGGLYCLSEQYNMFSVYWGIPEKTDNFSTGIINSFTELTDKRIVLADDGKGILFFDPEKKITTNFTNNDLLKSKHIVQVILKGNNELWCATWGGGISKIQLNNNNVTNYIHEKKNIKSLNYDNIKAINYLDSSIWIGTHGDGLAIYDPRKKEFFHHKNPILFPTTMNLPQWILCINKTSNNKIWIGTVYGVFLYDKDTNYHFLHQKSDSSTISDNYVYSIFEDSKKNVWLITALGVDKYNESTLSFERYSKTHDFPQYPKAIIEDNNGFLWITTQDGVSVISPDSFEKYEYDESDGIINGEFRQGSIYKASDGMLYFGSSKGFMSSNPEKRIIDTARPKIIFRDLYLNYIRQNVDSVILLKSLDVTDVLTMKYSTDILSIELAAIYFSKLNQITYSYKLEGFQDSWISLGKNRMITFSKLPPGKYTLHVRAKLKTGNETEKSIQIFIHPPWWMTYWFRISLVLFISLIIIIAVYLRIKLIKRQNDILQQKVTERTHDLKLANRELEIQAEKLQEQNMIVAIKNEELIKANDSKNKLFSIISHDLKNPLGAMQGLSEILLESFKSMSESNIQTTLSHIVNSTKSISELTMNLLNWSKIQTDGIKPKFEELDISKIVDECINLLKESARMKEINFYTKFNHLNFIIADKTMISTVIRNIINNSIKFTNKGGSITVHTENNQDYIRIVLSDTGVGMTKETIDSILHSNTNTPTYGTNNELGTGLGLVICKEFIEKNNAKLSISSVLNEGTYFSILIPKGTAIPNEAFTSVIDDTNNENEQIDDEQYEDEHTIEKGIIICVVEDNPEIQTYIRNIFQKYYRVEVAGDGKSGLALIKEIIPDIIISDITMPEMDGLKMVRELRKIPATNHIPVIILSSRDMDIHLIEGYQAGADDYVTKPFNKDVLFNKVKASLEYLNILKLHYKKKNLSPDLSTDLPESNDDKFLKDIIRIMEKEFNNESFTVEFLAERLSMGRVQVYRKLMAIVGMSPKDYITQYRLEKAALLLKSNKYRISDVAYEVGFSSPRYFSKCFNQHFGMNPKEYAEKFEEVK